MALKMCLRLDEKFEKFEHNIAFLGMEMADLYKEYAKLKAEFSGQIALLENEVAKLREENGILTTRLANNAAVYEQNLANIRSTLQNNDIATIKQEEEENVVDFGINRDPSEEQQHEIAPEEILEQKPHFTVNPLDELNEMSEDGFGQIEEEIFDEEGDEIMAGNSMEMNGIHERFGDVYGNNLTPHEGPSNIIGGNYVNGDGQQQQHSKKKIKILICQWPGCGYRMNAKYKRDMERHFRKHTGEKPYCCSICGQSFTRHNNMRNHELKQHNLI